MSFEVEGRLHKKFETESKTGTFQAREFVIEVSSGNYPQVVKFQLVQDRCALIDGFNEGDMIKVSFDLRGREWQGKYFTNLNAWRVEKAGEASASSSGSAPQQRVETAFPTMADEPSGQADDDLPF